RTTSAQLHTWPVLITREFQIASAARSRLASSSTMAGALPPSSRLTRVRLGAAAAMIALPAFTDPVIETILILGLVVRALPTDAPLPPTILKTPAGTST